MRQSCLDRFAFAAVLIVNNDFRAGFSRALRGLIARTVIDHKDVIEPLAGSANDVADMFFVLIRRNDRGGLRTNLSERIALATIVGLSRRARGRALSLSSPYHRMKVGRVIRAANQRAGGDMEKPFSARNVAVVIELLRRDVFDHG